MQYACILYVYSNKCLSQRITFNPIPMCIVSLQKTRRHTDPVIIICLQAQVKLNIKTFNTLDNIIFYHKN